MTLKLVPIVGPLNSSTSGVACALQLRVKQGTPSMRNAIAIKFPTSRLFIKHPRRGLRTQHQNVSNPVYDRAAQPQSDEDSRQPEQHHHPSWNVPRRRLPWHDSRIIHAAVKQVLRGSQISATQERTQLRERQFNPKSTNTRRCPSDQPPKSS